MQNSIDEYRLHMIKVLEKKYDLSKELGIIQSEIDALDFYFCDSPTQTSSIVYEPSLCIILQGSKSVGFGNELYRYSSKDYLLASTHVPATIKVLEASKQIPYLSLRIKFKLEDIYDVLKHAPIQEKPQGLKAEKGLYFDSMNEDIYEPVYRLVKLLNKPQQQIEYLSSFIIKEILFNLINGKSGYFLNKFVQEGTTSNKIVQVISEIKENYNAKLNVKTLAKMVKMSESSLYQNFKTITSMSPIQFQKKVRLEEARLMLEKQNIEVSEVAFNVGYESPSQFSREYSRMFGISPKAHAQLLKEQSVP